MPTANHDLDTAIVRMRRHRTDAENRFAAISPATTLSGAANLAVLRAEIRTWNAAIAELNAIRRHSDESAPTTPTTTDSLPPECTSNPGALGWYAHANGESIHANPWKWSCRSPANDGPADQWRYGWTTRERLFPRR